MWLWEECWHHEQNRERVLCEIQIYNLWNWVCEAVNMGTKSWSCSQHEIKIGWKINYFYYYLYNDLGSWFQWKLVEPIAKLVCKIMKLGLHLCEFVLPKESLHGSSVQDWSLQCPSHASSPFKIHLSQNNSSKRNPKLKMKTSLEVLNIIYMSEEPTSAGHCHYKKWS